MPREGNECATERGAVGSGSTNRVQNGNKGGQRGGSTKRNMGPGCNQLRPAQAPPVLRCRGHSRRSASTLVGARQPCRHIRCAAFTRPDYSASMPLLSRLPHSAEPEMFVFPPALPSQEPCFLSAKPTSSVLRERTGALFGT